MNITPFVKPIYMPILKWKRGELDGLRHVFAQDRPGIIPMLELLEDTIDTEDESATSSGVSPFDRAASQIKKSWDKLPFFIDAEALDVPSTAIPHAVESLFAACRAAGLAAIPVSGLSCSTAYNQAISRIMNLDGRGCAIRLDVDDLVAPNVSGSITTLMGALGLGSADIDLVLDWRAIDVRAGSTTYLAAALVVPALPHLTTWRSIVFAASSFPVNLMGVGVGFSTITRAEWVAYQLLLAHVPGGRALSFGDYAIAYPVYSSSPFPGSASIRYTISDDWLIVRGRAVRGPIYGGFGQFRQLCAQLVGNQSFCGAAFSWGDDYIEQCGRSQVGVGNMTTWRTVGTNHHLTFVARQLANHRVPSSGLAPPPVGP